MCDSMLFAGFSTRRSRVENGESGYDLMVERASEIQPRLSNFFVR